MKQYKEVFACRCCNGRNLVQYLDLGNQPLANAFHKGDKEQDHYPLKVNVCRECYHSQLSIAVDPNVLYDHYPYQTGTSQSFRSHCKHLATELVNSHHFLSLRVLDIGCNDGTLLEEFRNLGSVVTGVDPAFNLCDVVLNKDISVVPALWNKRVAENLGEKRFDVITSLNCFAHVDDNVEFLQACHLTLADDGVLIIEVPYFGDLFCGLQFDTIYHEHLSYFSIFPFCHLVAICGFGLSSLKFLSIHGGSVRFYLTKGTDEKTRMLNDPFLGREVPYGLFNYEGFAERVALLRDEIRTMFKSLEGQRVVGYGAAAKGNVMLNYCDVDLEYIVDDTPSKQGLLSPGKDIPIVSREILKHDTTPLNIVILPWNFKDEIVSNLRNLRSPSSQDHYIVCQPEVKRIPLFYMEAE